MKNPDWKSIAEIIGVAAIVASLIFVGLQMRQSHEIARSEANHSRAETSVSVLVDASSNPYFLSSMAKISNGQGDEMTGEERAARQLVLLAQLIHWENMYIQYLEGFFYERRWLASRASLKSALESTEIVSTRQIYEAAPGLWSSEFQELVDALLTEIDAESPM